MVYERQLGPVPVNKSNLLGMTVKEDIRRLDAPAEAPVSVDSWKIIPQLSDRELCEVVSACLCRQIFEAPPRHLLSKEN